MFCNFAKFYTSYNRVRHKIDFLHHFLCKIFILVSPNDLLSKGRTLKTDIEALWHGQDAFVQFRAWGIGRSSSLPWKLHKRHPCFHSRIRSVGEVSHWKLQQRHIPLKKIGWQVVKSSTASMPHWVQKSKPQRIGFVMLTLCMACKYKSTTKSLRLELENCVISCICWAEQSYQSKSGVTKKFHKIIVESKTNTRRHSKNDDESNSEKNENEKWTDGACRWK